MCGQPTSRNAYETPRQLAVQKLVYTQGSFDILHSGHIKLLQNCKLLGKVIVSLLTDKAYEKYRGYKPAMSYDERKAVLMNLRCVDIVIPGDNEKTKDELAVWEPDIVAVGSDWAKKDIYQQYGITQTWLDAEGIVLIYFPYTEGISSTDIKERCKK